MRKSENKHRPQLSISCTIDSVMSRWSITSSLATSLIDQTQLEVVRIKSFYELAMLPNKLWPFAAALLSAFRSRAAKLSDYLTAIASYTELINSSSSIPAGFQTYNSSYALTFVTALLQRDALGTFALSLYSDAAHPLSQLSRLAARNLRRPPLSPGSDPSALSPVIWGGNNLQLSAETKSIGWS